MDQGFIASTNRIVSPVVLAILGLLSADGLLKEPWDDWKTPPQGSGSITDGRYWLPHYEAVFRSWTNDAKLIAEITGDKLFGPLLAAKVTFLDDSDFLSKAKPAPKLPPPGSAGSKKSSVAPLGVVKSGRLMSSDQYE